MTAQGLTGSARTFVSYHGATTDGTNSRAARTIGDEHGRATAESAALDRRMEWQRYKKLLAAGSTPRWFY